MWEDVQEITGRFFSWWGRELRACIPRRLAAFLFGSDDALEIEIGANELSLSLRRNGELEKIGIVPIDRDDPDAVAAKTVKLLGRHAAARQVIFRLPHERALATVVELPVEAAGNLEEALAFELDSFTPFPSGEALFDFTVADSDEELERLRIELLVARRSDIDKALDWARRIGVRPDCIAGPASEEPLPGAFNLLPWSERRQRSRFLPRATAVLSVAALMLAAAALWSWSERRSNEIERLQALATELRTELGAAGRLRDRVTHLTEISGQLTEKKTREPMAIALLDELSRLLPDSDWLSSWSISENTVKVSGYSLDPAATLRLVERSRLLSDARFTSPLTMDPQLGKERFSLEAVVVTDGLQQ
jgi:general secretion pathway protein L